MGPAALHAQLGVFFQETRDVTPEGAIGDTTSFLRALQQIGPELVLASTNVKDHATNASCHCVFLSLASEEGQMLTAAGPSLMCGFFEASAWSM